jgi:hypothetical protein
MGKPRRARLVRKLSTVKGMIVLRIRKRPPSDLGAGNTRRLETLAASYRNKIFVDLGVRFGYSSEALLKGGGGPLNNCMVQGVDIDFSRLPRSLRLDHRYEYTHGDSATVGKFWNPLLDLGILFIDTIHVKEMILVELLMWQKHFKQGTTVVFHDTNWEQPGGETIAGLDWDRPEAAVVEFFGLSAHANFEDDRIRVEVFPESNGMTFVTIKTVENYATNVSDWNAVIEKRNLIIATYSTEEECSRLGIDWLV